MNCPDREDLMLWLDGELPPERTRQIERHLEECSACRRAVNAKKRMESLWRGNWQDPDDTAFTIMRRRLVSSVPWWRRQRSWMAVAAVFAVYFGVRIFLIDGSGTSMSELAREEQVEGGEEACSIYYDTPEVFVTTENSSSEDEIEEMTAAEPTEELILNTGVSSIDGSSEDSGTEQSEIIEELDICLSLSEEMQEDSEGIFEMEEEEYSSSPVESQELITVQHSVGENAAVSGACGGGFSDQTGSSGAGGGGTGGLGETTSSSDAVCRGDDLSAAETVQRDAMDAETRSMICQESPSSTVKTVYDYSVSAELESGERVILARGNWLLLFQLIDSYIEQYGSPGETLCLSIDSTGVVSGEEFMEGAVIDAPSEEYTDCSITVFVF